MKSVFLPSLLFAQAHLSISDISQQQRLYNSSLAPHVTDDNKSFDNNKGPGQASAAFPPGVYISQFQYGKQQSTSRQMPQKHFQLQGTSDFFHRIKSITLITL